MDWWAPYCTTGKHDLCTNDACCCGCHSNKQVVAPRVCSCSCHIFGGFHLIACCFGTTIVKDNISMPEEVNYAEELRDLISVVRARLTSMQYASPEVMALHANDIFSACAEAEETLPKE